jgi:hypothetical protein
MCTWGRPKARRSASSSAMSSACQALPRSSGSVRPAGRRGPRAAPPTPRPRCPHPSGPPTPSVPWSLCLRRPGPQQGQEAGAHLQRRAVAATLSAPPSRASPRSFWNIPQHAQPSGVAQSGRRGRGPGPQGPTLICPHHRGVRACCPQSALRGRTRHSSAGRQQATGFRHKRPPPPLVTSQCAFPDGHRPIRSHAACFLPSAWGSTRVLPFSQSTTSLGSECSVADVNGRL